MPNLFDNLSDEGRLAPALRASLRDYDRVDIATGYLDLRGWAELADVVDGKTGATKPTARVLIGMMAPADSAAILDCNCSDYLAGSVHAIWRVDRSPVRGPSRD